MSGFVLYSDQDCILHSLLLPQMKDDVVRRDNGIGAFHMCRFDVQHGRLVGETPVQSPDLRDVHLQMRDLRAIVRAQPNIQMLQPHWPLRIGVVELARLAPRWLALSLEVTPRAVETQYLFVLLEDKAPVTVAFGTRGPYENLVVSPERSLVAAGDGTVLGRTGGSVDPPQSLPDGRAVGFSPDERWLAWLDGASVFLVGTPKSAEPGRIIRLPVPARDLVWEPVSRGTSVGPPIRR